MEISDQIEKVNRKMFDKLRARNENLAVLFCKLTMMSRSIEIPPDVENCQLGIFSPRRYPARLQAVRARDDRPGGAGRRGGGGRSVYSATTSVHRDKCNIDFSAQSAIVVQF